jgi:hypothetical protein
MLLKKAGEVGRPNHDPAPATPSVCRQAVAQPVPDGVRMHASEVRSLLDREVLSSREDAT